MISMTFECEHCPFRTMDLGKAREHQLEEGHAHFRVYAGVDESYRIQISD